MAPTTTTARAPPPLLTLFPSHQRGHSTHGGWLESFHSFALSAFPDPRYHTFGALVALNEDTVAPAAGFPPHPHADMEIFTYVLRGALTHRDSLAAKPTPANSHKAQRLGDVGVQDDAFVTVPAGGVQFTTAGRGIVHSEVNADGAVPTTFLQVWVRPWRRGLAPRYHTRMTDGEERRRRFVTIVAPLGEGRGASEEDEGERAVVRGGIPIHADFLAGVGTIGEGVVFEWRVGVGGGEGLAGKSPRRLFVFVPGVNGEDVRVVVGIGGGAKELGAGDGLFIEEAEGGETLEVVAEATGGSGEVDVLVMDLE